MCDARTWQAISYLEKFLDLSKNANPSNHARACCSLGVIYSKQRKYDKAVKYFDKFFEVRVPHSIVSSSWLLCSSVHTHHPTVTSSIESLHSPRSWQAHDFSLLTCVPGDSVCVVCACSQVAKTLHDRRMLEVARVNLGIARGCVRTGRYMDVVANDLTSLLQWKNIRMPLDAF